MTRWTVACQAPLSMGSPRQKYWNGLPFPSPGDLPMSPALAGGFFTADSLGNPQRFRKVYGLAVFLLLLFFGKYSRKMVHKNLFLHISHYINAWLYPTARKSENKSLASHVYSAKNFILAD